MLSPISRQSKPGLIALGQSGERSINYFLRPSDGVSPAINVARSQVDAVRDLGAPVRAIQSMGGNLYAAAGGKLWRVSPGVAVVVGDIPDGATQMAATATELALVAAGGYYLYDGATVAQYPTGDVVNLTGIAEMDGYFIVTGSLSGRNDAFAVSNLDDGKTFDGLDFAFAESNQDGIVGIVRDHSALHLFGTETVEVFYNSGADFPFARNQGAVIEHGCANGSTIAKADSAVFWVRPDNAVMRSGAVVSTPEIQEAIRDSVVIGGFTFTDRGHEFYAIERENNTTLCFDLRTSLWAERSTGLGDVPWICTCQTLFDGLQFFGTSTGKIVELGSKQSRDDGEVIEGVLVSAPIEQRGDLFRVAKLHINMQTGTSDIGRDAQIMLQTTKDGREWGREKWRSIGRLGDYYKRITWHSLGQFRRFQFRLRITDDVDRDIYGAALG